MHLFSEKWIINNAVKVRKPAIPAVYFLINHYNKIVYIGSTEDVYQRIISHRQNLKLHFNQWFHIVVEDKEERQELERQYIARHTPKYNLKDNPIAVQEMELAISLLSEEEQRKLQERNGLISRERVEEILAENNIPTKIKRANPYFRY